MGVSISAGQLSAKLTGFANTIPKANRDAVAAAALVVKTRVLLRATPATGGDLKFSGTGNRKVGVRFKLEGERAFVKATGPFQWLEGPVKKHAVVPKGAGGSRASRSAFVSQAFGTGRDSLSFGAGSKGALKFAGAGGGSGFAAYARASGGHPAKRVWSKGVEESRKPVGDVFRLEHRTNLLRVFG